MNISIVTIYEKDHHLGVASLINSAIRVGFRGRVFVFHKGPVPPWRSSLNQDTIILADGSVKVVFKELSPNRHLRFHKPFSMLEVLECDSDSDGVIYVDPDIVFLAPWQFYEEWLQCGVALCLDKNFAWVHKNHPWRKYWKALVQRANLPLKRDTSEYANSGFVGVARPDILLLKNWIATTLQFEKEGGNTATGVRPHRTKPVVGDQDILAATLHSFPNEPAFIGQEGMGFNGHFFVLAHAVGNPKPWQKSFVWHALKGKAPHPAERMWLTYADSPIPALSKSRYKLARIDFTVGKLISRFWRR